MQLLAGRRFEQELVSKFLGFENEKVMSILYVGGQGVPDPDLCPPLKRLHEPSLQKFKPLEDLNVMFP